MPERKDLKKPLITRHDMNKKTRGLGFGHALAIRPTLHVLAFVTPPFRARARVRVTGSKNMTITHFAAF